MATMTETVNAPTNVESSTSKTVGAGPKIGTKLYNWGKRHGWTGLFGANGLGNLGVLLSALAEGNVGRASVAAGGLTRNSFGGIFNLLAGKGVFSNKTKLLVNSVFMGIPIITGALLIQSAATVPELLIGCALIGGYALKASSKFIQSRRTEKAEKMAKGLPTPPNKVLSSISKRVGIDINKGTSKGLDYIDKGGDFMPAILAFRGSMRTLDGFLRADPVAIGAGVFFVIGAGCMFMGDKHDREQQVALLKETSNDTNESKPKIQSGGATP